VQFQPASVCEEPRCLVRKNQRLLFDARNTVALQLVQQFAQARIARMAFKNHAQGAFGASHQPVEGTQRLGEALHFLHKLCREQRVALRMLAQVAA
jgi:hypothetical protein